LAANDILNAGVTKNLGKVTPRRRTVIIKIALKKNQRVFEIFG
jgi:hypothetical protein